MNEEYASQFPVTLDGRAGERRQVGQAMTGHSSSGWNQPSRSAIAAVSACDGSVLALEREQDPTGRLHQCNPWRVSPTTKVPWPATPGSPTGRGGATGEGDGDGAVGRHHAHRRGRLELAGLAHGQVAA